MHIKLPFNCCSAIIKLTNSFISIELDIAVYHTTLKECIFANLLIETQRIYSKLNSTTNNGESGFQWFHSLKNKVFFYIKIIQSSKFTSRMKTKQKKRLKKKHEKKYIKHCCMKLYEMNKKDEICYLL